MPATVTPLRAPNHPHDPALTAALAELTQLGLAVARVASRLAQVEDAALDVLAETARATTAALATHPASLGDARRIGLDADSSEAARDAATRRVATITECFATAARAVRRTVALQARLAAGHPFPSLTPAGFAPPVSPPTSRDRPAQPASRPRPHGDADSPDRPETGDELGATPDEAILQGIRRDLSAATITTLIRPPSASPASAAPLPPTRSPAAPAPLPSNDPGGDPGDSHRAVAPSSTPDG